MSSTAVLSTCDTSTSVTRDEQPIALTKKQKTMIENSWQIVEDDIGLLKGGIILFMRMFEVCPPVLKMFKKFRDVPFSELPENESLQGHALQVMETVSLAVSSLDDSESLVAVLREVGGAHGTHDLQQAQFDLVGECLLWTLAQGLGDKFTSEVKEAWTAMYSLVATEMKEGLEEYKELMGDDQ